MSQVVTPDARAEAVVGPRSERERRRFEAYCRWSMHIMVLACGFVAVVGVVTTAVSRASTLGWDHEAGLVMGSVGAGIAIVWSALAVVVTELICTERPVPRYLGVAFGVVAVLATYGSAVLLAPDVVATSGATPAFALGPATLAGTATVAALTRRWRLVLVGVALALGVLFLLYVLGPSRLSVPAAVAIVIMTLWVCLLLIPTAAATRWMIDVVRRLERSRQVVADLAVAEERLRFSRDLHDVFGRTLSTVAIKSELAAELARRGDDRAASEMLEVRELAHTALTDVRSLVRGYRRIELADEVAGARSVLRAAGIRTRVDGVDDLDDLAQRLPSHSAEALAWVVREGVTNVLRHGHGGDVVLRLTEEAGQVELCLANALPRVATTGTTDGSGLLGLRERVEAIGGSVHSGHTDSGFRLVARVPTG